MKTVHCTCTFSIKKYGNDVDEMQQDHTMNATGLFGGVRGSFAFGFTRDPNDDDRLVRDRERGFKTGLLRRKTVSEQNPRTYRKKIWAPTLS